MKNRVYEFDPVIYPTRVWVTKCSDIDILAKTFTFLDDNDEEYKDKVDIGRTTIVRVLSVAHKKSAWMGCLAVINLPKQCDVGIIAHESGHVTDWLCDHLGVSGFTFVEGEARQYYAGWVARCIDKVLKGRV